MTSITDTLSTPSSIEVADPQATLPVDTTAMSGTSNVAMDAYCPTPATGTGSQVDAAIVDKLFTLFQSFVDNLFKMFTTLIQTLLPQSPKPGQGTTGSSGIGGTGSTGNTGTSGSGGTTTTPGVPTTPPPSTKDPLNLTTGSNGLPVVKTEDGFTISFDGKDQGWSVTDPKGVTTHIWGDPHVDESDGDKWDFKKTSSFKFGKNKITVETSPAGNGTTYTKSLHIYSGDQRISIGGIDTNKVGLLANAKDATKHDRSILDGDVYSRADDKRKGHEGHEAWHRIRKAA